MTDRRTQQDAEQGNTIKDPDQWTTGDEPMTGAQRSYLHTLAEEARENIDDDLTRWRRRRRSTTSRRRPGAGKRVLIYPQSLCGLELNHRGQCEIGHGAVEPCKRI